MRPYDRYDWILMQVKNRQYVDILDQDFVDAYIESCGPTKVSYCNYGAHKVSRLGRDLSSMYRLGMIHRYKSGVNMGQGFPNWVYSYVIKQNKTKQNKTKHKGRDMAGAMQLGIPQIKNTLALSLKTSSYKTYCFTKRILRAQNEKSIKRIEMSINNAMVLDEITVTQERDLRNAINYFRQTINPRQA